MNHLSIQWIYDPEARMAVQRFDFNVPKGFRLATVATSHGWMDLPPFEWDRTLGRLSMVGRAGNDPMLLRVTQSNATSLAIEAEVAGRWSEAKKKSAVTHVGRSFGLGIDFGEFYRLGGEEYEWARAIGAGPFLRAATVFEDAVKMLATTNCSWSLTKLMTTRLIEALGDVAPGGKKAFPTPKAMAEAPLEFYRDEMRAGYRSAYFRDFARLVHEGAVDPESWPEHSGDANELIREIRSIRGFGKYSAENLARLLGRFDGLGLDSWCLKKYSRIRPGIKGDVSKAIERRYRRFGSWRGLALWLDLTRDWHENGAYADPTTSFEAK